MEKFLSLIFILLFLNYQSKAQKFIGPVAGISLAKYSRLAQPPGITSTASLKSGISLGVAFEMAINSQLFIQPELRFTQMGTTVNQDDGINTGEGTEYLNYVTIPILAKFKSGTKLTKFFLEIGPRIGFGIGDITDESYGTSNSFSYDEAEFKKFDFGLEVGAGVSFLAGTGSMFLDARYYAGLQKTTSGPNQDNAKNIGIGINVGFLFPIGK